MIAHLVQTELSSCQIECRESSPSELEIDCKLFRMRIELTECHELTVSTHTIRVLGAVPLVGAVDTEVLAILRDHNLYSNARFSHRMVGPAAMVQVVAHALAEHFVVCLKGAIVAVEEANLPVRSEGKAPVCSAVNFSVREEAYRRTPDKRNCSSDDGGMKRKLARID